MEKGESVTGNLSGAYEADIAKIKNKLSISADFVLREKKSRGIKIGIAMFDGLISNIQVSDFLFRPLSDIPARADTPSKLSEYLTQELLVSSGFVICNTFEEVYTLLMTGFAVVLIDGCSQAIAVGYQGFTVRPPGEPSGEINIRGSREGFNEMINTNTALIRRRLKSEDLVAKNVVLGKMSKTAVRLIYIRGRADEEMIKRIEKRLSEIKTDLMLDSGYIQPFLEQRRFSFFSGIGVTERPDVICAKIMEGRAALIVDGSPFALIIPYLFIEYFHTLDDYTQPAYFVSFMRILRLAAFVISVLLPGIYVAAVSFHPELIPVMLINRFISSAAFTPLPVLLEALTVFALFELLREAGLRLPGPIGHAMGLVGGIIIGDAGVQAGIIGLPLVIVIAVTAVCSFVIPKLYEPVMALRLIFILLGGLTGLFGIYAGMVLTVINICSLDSIGIPAADPGKDLNVSRLRDMFIRSGWKKLQKKSFNVSDKSR